MLRYRYIFIAAILFLLSACATYHPLKIDSQAVNASLKPPDMSRLAIAADKIHHPLLKPLRIDLADGLSPDEAAVLAVLANPELKSIRDEKKIARAELLQAGILPNPQLGVNYDFPTGGNTTHTVNAFGLQLGWDVTSLIGRSDRISAARSKKADVDLMVAWQEWQVAESAKLHLLHVLWADRRLDLLEKEEKSLSRNLALIRKAVALGEKTAVELAAAESEQRQIQLEISTVEQQREQARLSLNQDLGMPPVRRIRIEKEPMLADWPDVSANADFFPGVAKRRPDLLALKMGYKSQEARLRGAILSQFPDIGIDVHHSGDTSNVISTGLGANISFPFFDHAQGRIAIQKATRRKLYDAYMARIFTVRANLAAIMKKIAATRKRIATAEESVAAQKRLVDIYKTALDQGNADILTYYQAQNKLMNERLTLLSLRESLTDLGVALETTAGVYFPMNNAAGRGKK